jgi:O-antigen/teichoic acid export membrane protein
MVSQSIGDIDLSVEVLKGVSAKFTQAVLGFAGTILFARILGPTSFGGFYLVMSLVRVVDWPTRGLATAAKKRYSESDSSRKEIVGAQVIANLALIGVVGVIAIVFQERLISYSGVDSAPSLFFIMFVALVFFYPFQQLLTARGLVGLQAWNDTVRSVTTFLLQLGLVLAGWGVAGMAVGWTLSTVLAVPITFYFLRTVPALPSIETLRSLFSYAKYSSLTAIAGKTYARYDVLLLGLVIGPAASGYYEAALKLSVPATFVATIAGSGLMAKVSNRHNKGQNIDQTVSDTLSYSSILAIPMFFGGVIISEQLVVTAYGAKYREAAVLLVGLLLYQLVRTQSRVLTQTLSGMDMPDLIMRISVVTLVTNVVLGYGLLITVGLIGVVIGTVVAESVRYLCNAMFVHRYEPNVTIIPRQIRLQVLSSGLMCAVVFLLERVVKINSFVILGTIVGAGACVYGVSLFVLSDHFRDTCTRILSNFVG